MRRTNTQIPIEILGNNAGYYVEVANKNDQNECFTSWNWASFFFPAWWLIYRRCYLGAVIVMIISSVTSIFSTIFAAFLSAIVSIIFPFSIYNIVVFICSLLPNVLCGIFGNALYFYLIKSKIERLELAGFDKSYVINKSAPSIVPVAICFGILISIIAIFLMLFFAFIFMIAQLPTF